MPWTKLDDSLYDHPKFLDLTLEAVGLWTLTLTWSTRQLTDGRLPRKAVDRLAAGNRRLAGITAELVTAGLWDDAPDGWVIHDFHDYQPTAAGVEEERRKARERQAKHRNGNGRYGKSQRQSRRDTPVTNDEVPADVTGESPGSHVHPDPTRPETPPTPSTDPPVTVTQQGAGGPAPGVGTGQNHHDLVDAAMAAAAAHELATLDHPPRHTDGWTAAKLKAYEPKRTRALELAQAGAAIEGLGDFFITGQAPTIRTAPPSSDEWTDEQRATALAQSAGTRAAIRATLAARNADAEPTDGVPS